MSEKKPKISIPDSLRSVEMQTQESPLQLAHKKGEITIGVPNEIDNTEKRVALVPATVGTLISMGFRVVIETEAGTKAAYPDYYYSENGADIAYNKEQIYASDIIVKISPLTKQEVALIRPDTIIMAPLRIPNVDAELLTLLKKKRVIAIATEWLQDSNGNFPIVNIHSELAGSSAISIGTELLSKSKGVHLGGITGVPPAKVVIIGAGVVASTAARIAIGYGAEVRVFDNDINKLMKLRNEVGHSISTSTLNPFQLEKEVTTAELVIGAIHSKNRRTPVVISEEIVSKMKPGSIIIDLSIDQGGCFATSRMTTHDKPTYIEHDVIHYCVPNISAKVPRTASIAFSNIMAFILTKASEYGGFEQLIHYDKGFSNGVYIYKTCLTNDYLGEKFGIKSTNLDMLLSSQLW